MGGAAGGRRDATADRERSDPTADPTGSGASRPGAGRGCQPLRRGGYTLAERQPAPTRDCGPQGPETKSPSDRQDRTMSEVRPEQDNARPRTVRATAQELADVAAQTARFAGVDVTITPCPEVIIQVGSPPLPLRCSGVQFDGQYLLVLVPGGGWRALKLDPATSSVVLRRLPVIPLGLAPRLPFPLLLRPRSRRPARGSPLGPLPHRG
jgi:hypothetical protein